MITREILDEIYDKTVKGRALDDILADPGMPDIKSLQKHLRDDPDEMVRYKTAKKTQRALIADKPEIRKAAEASRTKVRQERRNAKQKDTGRPN